MGVGGNVKFTRMPIQRLRNERDVVTTNLPAAEFCNGLEGLLITHGFSLKSPLTMNSILDRK